MRKNRLRVNRLSGHGDNRGNQIAFPRRARSCRDAVNTDITDIRMDGYAGFHVLGLNKITGPTQAAARRRVVSMPS